MDALLLANCVGATGFAAFPEFSSCPHACPPHSDSVIHGLGGQPARKAQAALLFAAAEDAN